MVKHDGGILGSDERARVDAALAAAHRTTAAELVAVVRYDSRPYVWGDRRYEDRVAIAAGTMLGVALAIVPCWVVLILALAMLLGLLVTRSTWFMRRIFRAALRRAVSRRSEDALYDLRLRAGRRGTGVSLLVSRDELMVSVCAEPEIVAKVGQDRLQQAERVMRSALHSSGAAASLVAGIEALGPVLAEHLPRAVVDADVPAPRVAIGRW